MSTDGDDTDASDDDEAGVFDYDPEWSEFLDQGMMCARSGDVEGFAHAIDALRQLRDDFDEWARGYGMPYFSWMATAARAGQVEIMQLIVAMDMCVMDHWIMACLARNGHVHVLEWALEHGLGLGVDIICEEAARRGRVNVLKFARLDHDCHWDENTPRLAALGGHSQCLKFAYKNGCRFNAEVTRAAVRGGKLNCLRYLHEVVKCPWDEGSCIEAAEGALIACNTCASTGANVARQRSLPPLAWDNLRLSSIFMRTIILIVHRRVLLRLKMAILKRSSFFMSTGTSSVQTSQKLRLDSTWTVCGTSLKH